MDFYDRVKALVKEHNLTIAAVAEQAGLTIDSYNSYRRHNNLPRADEAVRIARALHTSVEYLVTGEEAAPPSVDKERIAAAVKALMDALGKV